jgi:hypothetical protein
MIHDIAAHTPIFSLLLQPLPCFSLFEVMLTKELQETIVF